MYEGNVWFGMRLWVTPSTVQYLISREM